MGSINTLNVVNAVGILSSNGRKLRSRKLAVFFLEVDHERGFHQGYRIRPWF